eukprot:3672784-Prymnesium_polylepis.1
MAASHTALGRIAKPAPSGVGDCCVPPVRAVGECGSGRLRASRPRASVVEMPDVRICALRCAQRL